GRVGVAIDSLEDMRVLFDGIPLAEVSTSMTINATAATLLALYQAVGEEQGAQASQLRGTIQNDILKEYIARGTYIYPPAGSMRLITDLFTYGSREVPQWNTVSISGYHIREAGSDAVQEIAFTLADGIAYVEAALAAGLDVADFIDPLGGAWAVEALTAEIERRVAEYLARIDELGGMVRAIEVGFPQREIERRAYEHQRAVEARERIVVGVNQFALADEPAIPIATVDPALEADQVRRVQALRARRSAGEVARALTALDDAAAGTANLVVP